MFGIRLYRLAIIAVIAWNIHASKTTDELFTEHTVLFDPSTSLQDEEVFNEKGEHIGFFLTTSPTCDHLKGYSGPTNVAIRLDRFGKVTDLRIVQATDTIDHVNAVANNQDFWEKHHGLALGSPGNPTIDSVSGSTLTSQAISRAIIERLGGTTTSRLFPTEILLAELPEADSIEKHPSWPGVMVMHDKEKKVIGHALRTAPQNEYLKGFQGPSDVLIVLDAAAERITRLRFRKGYDNDDYYERILDESDYLSIFDQLRIAEVLNLEWGSSKLEGVSGATDTSWVIAESVKRRLARFQTDRSPKENQISWRNICLIGFVMGAFLFSFTKLRGHLIARILWQLLVIVGFGLFLGDLLSQALLLGWAQHGLPWENSFGLIALALAALLTPLTTGHQLYCHQLCPHGFLQRWLSHLPIKPMKIPPNLHRLLSRLPSLLLILMIASVLTGLSWNLSSFEGFDAWLWRSAGLATILIALIGLVASLFFPLAYCKYGCPTGALFQFIRTTSGSKKLDWRDLTAAILCLFAISI